MKLSKKDYQKIAIQKAMNKRCQEEKHSYKKWQKEMDLCKWCGQVKFKKQHGK